MLEKVHDWIANDLHEECKAKNVLDLIVRDAITELHKRKIKYQMVLKIEEWVSINGFPVTQEQADKLDRDVKKEIDIKLDMYCQHIYKELGEFILEHGYSPEPRTCDFYNINPVDFLGKGSEENKNDN